jgi:hypothetical protein
MLKLHNPALAVLRESMIAPGLLEHAANLAFLCMKVEELGWEKFNSWQMMPSEELNSLFWLDSIVKTHAPGVISCPLLSEEFCQELDAQFDFWCYEGAAQVNENEDKPYQIPEITLQDRCLPLFNTLETFRQFWITTISTLRLGFQCDYVQSIQLARYEPSEVSGGNFHVDADSDLSVVIPIRGSHLYQGGGVELMLDLFHPVRIEPIPVGHGLFFRGKTTLHRGLPVTSGKRDLLVYWTTSKVRG